MSYIEWVSKSSYYTTYKQSYYGFWTIETVHKSHGLLSHFYDTSTINFVSFEENFPVVSHYNCMEKTEKHNLY